MPARDIFIAVRDKNIARLKEVLKIKHDRVNDLDSDEDGNRWGVLHYLCVYPSYDAAYIDLLVEHGADVNVRNNTQETPLMLAVIYDHVRAAECLLKHGARPECSDWAGRTALSTAKDKKGRLKETFVSMIENSLAKPAGDRKVTAEELRQKGNEAWRQDNVHKAVDLYTKSLAAYEDYRTLSNRAACWLRMREWNKATKDAARAAAVQPTFEKSWIRLLKGLLGLRDLPRMRFNAERALVHCPRSAKLSNLLSILRQLAVPEHWSNPLSDEYENALAAIRAGQESTTCPYCLHVIPLPLSGTCPRCTCDPRNSVDSALVAQMERLCEVGATSASPAAEAVDTAQEAAQRAAVRQAAVGGDCDALRRLQSSGVKLGVLDEEGLHAALHAVEAGQVEALRVLVELEGVETLARASAEGELPAHRAAANGDDRMLELLQELGGRETLARAGKEGAFPAHVAASAGHAGVIRVLQRGGAGASLVASMWDGRTPLHCAAAGGHEEAVAALCECGASALSKADRRGNLPLHLASEGGHPAIVRLLCDKGGLPAVAQRNLAGAQPAHVAAERGHVTCVRVLGELRADLAAHDGQGRTPALVAAAAGQVEVLRALQAERGGDTGRFSSSGWTAAHVAAECGQLDVLSALPEMGLAELLAGADEQEGLSPAHVAAERRQAESIRRLHQLGASLVATDRRGRAPVHLAALNGDAEVLSALLDCGAGVSMLEADGSGKTATEYACSNGQGSWLISLCKQKFKRTSWASRCVKAAERFAAEDEGSRQRDAGGSELFDKMIDAIDHGQDHSELLEKLQSTIRQDGDAAPSWLFDKMMGTIGKVSRETTQRVQTGAGRASVRVCARCGASDAASDVKLMRCTVCKVASYCSRECQKADWKQHKRLCKTK